MANASKGGFHATGCTYWQQKVYLQLAYEEYELWDRRVSKAGGRLTENAEQSLECITVVVVASGSKLSETCSARSLFLPRYSAAIHFALILQPLPYIFNYPV
jgi:hypothetical protein